MFSQLRRLFMVCAAAVLVFAGVPAAQGSAAVSQWRITDLGTPYGTDWSGAYGINNRGHVVGQSIPSTSGNLHAVLWRDGRMIDLGTLGTNSYSYATAVNDRDEVVGVSYGDVASGAFHAFLWRNGQMIDLGTLGGSDSAATSINDRGEVAGTSSTSDGAMHAFLWRAGVMSDLGTLNGGFSRAYGVNNNGQVVGESSVDGMNSVPVMWRNGRIEALGSQFGYAQAINDRGQVVGKYYGAGRGFLWQRGRTTELDPSGQVYMLQVNGINDEGMVVGTNLSGAFVWFRGQFTTLPDLGGGAAATSINSRNQIVGFSNSAEGKAHAVLWTR